MSVLTETQVVTTALRTFTIEIPRTRRIPRRRGSVLLDHDAKSLTPNPRVFAGQKGGLTRDDVLDSVMLFGLTDTALLSARFHREIKLPFFGGKGVTVPSTVRVLPDEIYRQIEGEQ